MKILGLILGMLLGNMPAGGLHVYRVNYTKAADDKSLCKTMISELEQMKNISTPGLAYLGAFQTIWAKHTYNPLSKLATFERGKKNIEMACENEPTNVEVRFIRLSVQKNAPAFLGYRANIKEDEEFLRKNRPQIQSEILQKNVDAVLKLK